MQVETRSPGLTARDWWRQGASPSLRLWSQTLSHLNRITYQFQQNMSGLMQKGYKNTFIISLSLSSQLLISYCQK